MFLGTMMHNELKYGRAKRALTMNAARLTPPQAAIDAILNKSSFTGFTFAMHMRFDDTTNWSRIFDFRSENILAVETIYLARYETTDRLQFYSGGVAHETSGFIVNGTWYHLAATLDAANNFVIYKDGAPFFTGTQQGPPMTTPRPNSYLFNRYNNTRPFNGAADDVRLFDRALNSAEIVKVMRGQVMGDEIMHFPFDDDTLNDISKNGHHLSGEGTLAYQNTP